jgi:N-sulfoglucosamine sulfohydrolase
MIEILTGIMKNLYMGIFIFLFLSCSPKPQELPLPNILWITSEDNSPFLGCYGDAFASTPNLDHLAQKGFLYTHAYANAPVCAPARNTILTGIYANSGGNQHMRSFYPKSDQVKTYPELLRAAGYYCTNNVKEDYNLPSEQTQGIWDESSSKAHYRHRAPGQPFFAVFNTTISHESSIHKYKPSEDLKHKPEGVKLPPYHPDIPEMRHDWAHYYDNVEDMDNWVGSILKELDESGEAENTIIFYYGDHGGILARSKRYVYESGTRIPFIIYIPEKYKYLFPAKQPGAQVDRLISFVDLVPTLLSIVGAEIPDYLQGHAFLGNNKTNDPEYAFMFRDRMDEKYDMSRAVRDKKYRYIRNYMPHRIYGQYLEYLWRAPSVASWEEACKNGLCNEVQNKFWNTKPAEELYDTENDPWEVNNLANDPGYREVLERMRKAHHEWVLRIQDTGFIPESDLTERRGETTPFDYMRSGKVDLPAIVEAAEVSSNGSGDAQQFVDMLKSHDSAIRYWGATGLLLLGDEATLATKELLTALNDPSVNVAIVAAEALYKLGKREESRQTLLKALDARNQFTRTHALNVLGITNEDSPIIKKRIEELIKTSPEPNLQDGYDIREANNLLTKWGKREKEN